MVFAIMKHICNNSTFRGDMPPLSYNEFEWLALVAITFKCIEWEWHKSLPVNSEHLWNYQFNQKHEI